MAIVDDFKVYPYSKVIRYVGNNDNVYTCAAFYSYLQNLFDEPGYMSYQKPIKYNTPTSYTMLNGWFLDNGDPGDEDYGNILAHLYEGSINTSGYSTVDDPVLMMDLTDATPVDFATTDKDLTVRNTDDTENIGPLLAFKNDYPVDDSARIWFRNTLSATTPGSGDGIEVTTAGGSGDYTDNSIGPAISGDEVYANIYNIASWAGSPNAQVYIKQSHPIAAQGDIRVAEWSNANNWDRGATTTEAIDILLPVKLGGSAIDSGSLTLYGRQTGDTFTHTVSSVSTTDPSRTPIAMETSADEVNITKGEHYLLADGATDFDVDFSVGDVIQNVGTDSTTPPSWYAEVVAVTEFSTATKGVLTIRGLRGSITDDDDIYVGTAIEGVANGTPGGTYTEMSAEGTALTVGLTCTGGTSTAKRVLKGRDSTVTELAHVFAVDEAIVGASKDVYYKDFTTGETITDSGSGTVTHQASTSTSIVSDYTDVTIAHVNGSVTVSNVSGLFEVGEVVNYTNPSASAICLTAITTGSTTLHLGNVDSGNEPTATSVFTGQSSTQTADCDSTMTDDDEVVFNFALQSEGPEPDGAYSVVIEGGAVYNAGRTLEDIYAYIQYKCRDGETDVFYTSDGSSITQIQGQFYITANATYSVSKTAPFGTLAGGVFFGAQAVWIQGMDSSDNNSITLTDQNSGIQEPYTSINVTVSNTRVGDRVVVYLEDGSNGLPDKTQFTSHATNNVQADNDFVGSATHPNDTPTTDGWVYVVATDESEEHKYRYSGLSTTNTTNDTLDFPTVSTGTATAGTSGQALEDTSADFGASEDVEVGDFIYRDGDKAWAYVVSVDGVNDLTTTVLSDGTDWAPSDVYFIHQLVQAYDGNDKYYIPYLEGIENAGTDISPGNIQNSLTYVSDRAVGVRIRNVQDSTYKIIPFNTTNDITNTGMSQSVIRTTDEVYT